MGQRTTDEEAENSEKSEAAGGGTSRRTLLKGALGTVAISPALAERVAAGGQKTSVEFIDQVSGGRTVEVERVYLSEAGFVSIHDGRFIGDEGNVGIGAGSIIGYSEYLEAGLHENVIVPLFEDEELNFDPYPDRRLRTLQYLIALPHKDSNGNQVWDFYPGATEEDPAFNEGNTTETFPLNRTTDSAVIVSGDVSVGEGEVPLAYDG